MLTKTSIATTTPFTTYSSEWFSCDFVASQATCPWCLRIAQAAVRLQTDRKSLNDDYLVTHLTKHEQNRVLFVFFSSSESSQYMKVVVYGLHEAEEDEDLTEKELGKQMLKETESIQNGLKSFAKAPIEGEVPALTAETEESPLESSEKKSTPTKQVEETASENSKAVSQPISSLPKTRHMDPVDVLICSLPLPAPKLVVARSLFQEIEEAEKKDPAQEKEQNRQIFIKALEKIKSKLENIKQGTNHSNLCEKSPQSMASKLFADLTRFQRSLPAAQLDQDPTIRGLIAEINAMRSSIFFRH